LIRALSEELQRLLPSELERQVDAFVERIQALPPGLRAMASIYQLDVSITLDDLGWHFANWHHRAYCNETLRGLALLEAQEAADIFSQAYALATTHWETIGRLVSEDFRLFTTWYPRSELARALAPLNERIWTLRRSFPDYGLMTFWLTFARKYPEKVSAAAR